MKIANKISLSFLITALILTAIAAPIFYITAKKNLEDRIYAHLRTTAQSRANHIETYFKGHKQTVELLAQGAIFKELLSTSKEAPEYKKKLERVNKRINNVIEVHKEIFKVCLLDKNGIVVASTDKACLESNRCNKKTFLRAKEASYIGSIHICELSGRPAQDIAAPVLFNGESPGVIIVDIDVKQLFAITLDRTGLGETGKIYLVNKEGYMITPLRFKRDTFLKQKVDTVNFRNCLSMAKHPKMHIGHKPVDVFPDYRGVNVLGTHEYLPEMQWSLLAEIDEKEALAPLAKIKTLFVTTMTFVPIAAWLIGIFVSKLISGPIHKLHSGTEVIGKGNLDYKVGTDAKNEIGQLSRAFDNMTNNLKRSTTSIDNLNKEITERKKAELKQDELLKKVDNINKELKEFASIVSHDLKAPLRGIKTLASWILSDCADKLGDQANEQMNLLLERVERMYHLIEGALQYSRAGRVEGQRKQVNLNNFVPEIIDMVVPPENITVTIKNELPVIECEETHIMQVFQNLLSNAIKYMDKPQGWIKVGCVEQDGFWKFSVADNGPGIEEKHFENIFKIFQALPTSPDFQGTGVGLTVVKKIVELYDGKIWVESKVGEGSTFFFTLPKSDAPQEVSTGATSENIKYSN
jgi:signal transduction histidine kinase